MRRTAMTRARSLIAALALAAGVFAGGSAAEAAPAAAFNCPTGTFCIQLDGVWHVYSDCTRVLISAWGPAPFINNQASGTVARAYGANGTTVVWSNTAKSSGTADVTSWWYFRPC